MADLRTVEARLADLAHHIEWPHADVASSVAQRLAQHAPPVRVRGWQAATAVTLVVVGTLLATPFGRRAVADLLGVVGIEIRFGDVLEVPEFAGLGLGDPVTLDAAVDTALHDALVPASPPDAVYRSDEPVPGRISMVWRGDPALAAAPGVSTLYIQFPSRVEEGVFSKRLGPDVQVEAVTVRGVRGFWISGAPHVLTFILPGGHVVGEQTRLAGNTLLWEEGGAAHRIELVGTLQEALARAEALVPAGDR